LLSFIFTFFQQSPLPEIFAHCELAIEKIKSSLARITHLFPSLAADILASQKLVDFLQNGLPLGVQSATTSYMKNFLDQWRIVHKEVMAFRN
jgi:hypothetical protein